MTADVVTRTPEIKVVTLTPEIEWDWPPYEGAWALPGGRVQNAQRASAGELWREHGAVFARSDGRPLDPRADWAEFKTLLTEAGIDDRRLHDGSRHTAGTILNELGVELVTTMEILRHTQISQRRRHVKGRSHLSQDAMRRMGDTFLPQQAGTPVETTIETAGTRADRARRRHRVR